MTPEFALRIGIKCACPLSDMNLRKQILFSNFSTNEAILRKKKRALILVGHFFFRVVHVGACVIGVSSSGVTPVVLFSVVCLSSCCNHSLCYLTLESVLFILIRLFTKVLTGANNHAQRQSPTDRQTTLYTERPKFQTSALNDPKMLRYPMYILLVPESQISILYNLQYTINYFKHIAIFNFPKLLE